MAETIGVRADTLTLHTTVHLYNPPDTINSSNAPFASNTADRSQSFPMSKSLPRQECNTQCTQQLAEAFLYPHGSPHGLICQQRIHHGQRSTGMINPLCENLGSTEDTRPSLQAQRLSVEAESNHDSRDTGQTSFQC